MKAKKANASRAVIAVVAAGLGWMLLSRLFGSETLKEDERVVFVTTAARYDPSANAWTVPIHGWVHELEKSVIRKKTIETILESKYGVVPTDATRETFDARVRLFLADNERGKRVTIRIGDRTFKLPSSRPNGHFRGEITLPASEVESVAEDGTIEFNAVLPRGDSRDFSGEALLRSTTGLSVISDIDDTVKITHVTDRRKMLANTFLHEFKAVPGMAELYAAWAEQGVGFHFVSSSPWQLYEPLSEFLERSGFPPATFSLKLVRLKDSSILNIFKEGTETKPLQIEAILRSFPKRRFVLIGDSGEQDPEVYANIARKHPTRISAVFIRNVSGASPEDEHFRRVFSDLPRGLWSLFDHASELELPE